MIELWDHQKRAIEKAQTMPSLALFMEIGTGKTATMIHILRNDYNTRKKVAPTLIFAPLSVCPQWRTEIAKFSKIPLDKVHVLTGPGSKRAKEMERILTFEPSAIVVTNYEAVQIESFYNLILKWSPEIVVMDESHRLKEPTTVRSKRIYPLTAAARRKFIMTGTPILNSMLDIFGQYKQLDDSIFGGNFFTFRLKYFYDRNAGMPSHVHFPDWQPRPEAAKKIAAVLAKTSIQAKKEDCLDLPPLLEVPVPVSMSDAQRTAYQQMENDFVTLVGDQLVVAEFAMTKTAKMQQLLAGFAYLDDDNYEWMKDVPRLKALEDLLDSIGPQRVIIWTTFAATYDKLQSVAEKAGHKVVRITGQETALQKQAALEAFKSGEATALISHPAAGGAGLNMQEAAYSIYYTKGYSLEHYLQSQGRNYRAGSNQHQRVTHYHLYTEGTLDEVISQALLSKQDVAEAVLGHARKLALTKPSVTRTTGT